MWPGRREGFAREAGPGQGLLSECQAAAGLAPGDPEPETEELRGVSAPVVGRRSHVPALRLPSRFPPGE